MIRSNLLDAGGDMFRSKICILSILWCSALLAVPASAQELAALYKPTILFYDDAYSTKLGNLNNRGDYTVRYSSGSPTPSRDFIYTTEGTEVGLLETYGLNDRRQAVGLDFGATNQPTDRYYGAYKDGDNIKQFVPGYYPVALNNSGVAVGKSDNSTGATGSVVFDISTGNYSMLPALNGMPVFASDINDSGQVVGTARNADGSTQAFLFDNGEITALPFGANSQAFRINSSGQILGNYVDSAGSTRTVLYSDGAVIDLTATVGMQANPAAPPLLNDLGQIPFLRDGEYHIYIDGVAYPIRLIENDPDRPVFYDIAGLNDKGQLLTMMCPPNTGIECTAVRLDFVTTIPEPPVWAMLAAGLLLVARPWRRRAAPIGG